MTSTAPTGRKRFLLLRRPLRDLRAPAPIRAELIGVLLALVFAASSCGPVLLRPVVPGTGAGNSPDPDKRLDLAPPPPARRQLFSHLLNGGFEQLNPDGSPTSWTTFRRGFLDNDAALAHSGNASVRSSMLFGYYQDVAPPASPGQNVATLGWVRREFAEETVRIRFFWFDAADAFVPDSQNDDLFPDATPAPTTWTPFWTLHRVPFGATRAQFFIGGRNPRSWLRFDDLKFVRESFKSPSDESGEPWEVANGAIDSGATQSLPPGAVISQRVATGRLNEQYFVVGRADTAAPGSLVVRDSWLARDDAEPTPTLAVSAALPVGGGAFLADFDRPEGLPGGLSRVELLNAGTAPVTLSHLARGFAKVEPNEWITGANSPDSTLTMTLALDEALVETKLAILDVSGTTVATPPVVATGTTHRAAWNEGWGAAAGSYTARFEFLRPNGDRLVVQRPFTITRRDRPDPPVDPYVTGKYTRCVWIWLVVSQREEDLRDAIRLAKADGFEFGFFLLRTDQLPALKAAAEAEQFPFFVQTIDLVFLFNRTHQSGFFSATDYNDEAKAILQPVLDSPWYLGFYPVDEPPGNQLDTYGRIARAAALDPALRRAFSIWIPSAVELARGPDIAAPVTIVDPYPFTGSIGTPDADGLIRLVKTINDFAKSARIDSGRPLWITNQAFETPVFDPFRAVPPALVRAQFNANLVGGAQGIFPFTLTEIFLIEGIRDENFQPTRKHPPIVENNRRTKRLEVLLGNLDVPRLFPDAPFPIVASEATHTVSGVTYAFVMNADPFTTHTATLTFDTPAPAPLFDLLGERTLPAEAGRVTVILPPGEAAMMNIGAQRLAAISTAGDASPPFGTISFDTTHEFTYADEGGTVSRVVEVDLSPDASAVAVGSQVWYIFNRPQIWVLAAGGQTTRLAGPLHPYHRWRFLPDGRYLALSDYLGAAVFDPADLDAPELAWEGRSGAAFDLLEGEGGNYWLAAFEYGIRRLVPDAPGFLPLDAAPNDGFDAFFNLFGPFPGGRATVQIQNQSIDRIAPGAVAKADRTRTLVRKTHSRPRMNGRRQLALPMHQRGVALIQLAADGTPGPAATIASDTVDATAVAWLRDDLLAVADGVMGVRFYVIDEFGRATAWHRWVPPAAQGRNAFYIWCLAAAGDRLAVGFEDGRVIVVGTREILDATPPRAGMVVY